MRRILAQELLLPADPQCQVDHLLLGPPEFFPLIFAQILHHKIFTPVLSDMARETPEMVI